MAKKTKAERELAEVRAEDAFHKREWRVQRIGWALLAILLLSACAGLFGGGPFARQTLDGSDGVLEFDKFVRRHASTEWKIEPARSDPADSEYVVRISSAFLERYKVSAISPEPISTALLGPQVLFKFDASGGIGEIVFHVEPGEFGLSDDAIQLGDSEPIRMKQFVYP